MQNVRFPSVYHSWAKENNPTFLHFSTASRSDEEISNVCCSFEGWENILCYLSVSTLNAILTRRFAHSIPHGNGMQICTSAVCKLNMLQYLVKAEYTSHNNTMVTCWGAHAHWETVRLENAQFWHYLILVIRTHSQ